MKASEILIPEPCNEDWEGMTPEQRGRFCAACQKKVHDLSAMSEREARRLLDSDDDICVSYLSDNSGDVRFRPEPVVPLTRLVRRASVASAAGLSLALAACAPHGEGPKIEDTIEAESPAFLEVQPSIPDAEPCESEPPVIESPLVEEEPEELIRLKGDVARPDPIPRKKGTRIRRTAGKPRSPIDHDPFAGL